LKALNPQHLTIEIRILAGGLSTRMGREKSHLRLGQRTLLDHLRAAARKLNLPVRVIKRDAVTRCGPIGGIYTVLKTSRKDAVLFLACDMPFVSPEFLGEIIHALGPSRKAVFAGSKTRPGFPLLLRSDACLPFVTQQIAQGRFSLQALAGILKATFLRPARNSAWQLSNINTPADLAKAREQMSRLAVSKSKTLHKRRLSKQLNAGNVKAC
jgi:molybdopterin-guanine dinucleotide biosynthesis protein A